MRKITDINRKWAFSKLCEEVPTEFNNRWDIVNIPHCWNGIDGQDGGNDYYRGRAWYVKVLEKSELPPAQRHYIEFEGANSCAALYIDGKFVCRHNGGYSSWRADITDFIGKSSLIAVCVDNSPDNRTYPQMADFTFYGGIYRNVRIISVSDSHFDLDYYGGQGVTVTPEIVGNDARVKIECFLNGYKKGQCLRYRIFDREKNTIAELESQSAKETINIPSVHLWHGKKDPYLYTAEVCLIDNDEVADNVSVRFGCRSFSVDADRGFILNGEEYPLRGVARHQDRPVIGNALLPCHHNEDIKLIAELGATTVRLAHYQHDRYFYDLCDEYGIIVWAEIPYISKHLTEGRENTVIQMTELIVQNYNHPSIVVWGLSNEIGIGGTNEDLLENHRILNDLCHSLDPTRLTAVAAVSVCSIDDPYLLIPDLVCYNHYFGWYGGDVDMNGPWFDEFHRAKPNIPIGCSEYGCEALDWHSSEPVQGDYTEEYQTYYHCELIKQLFSRKYIWATYVWNMFDFGADARMEGGENGQNHKGLVTFDRKYKKDAFYAYKAWLSDEPFVHICGKRYVDRVEDVTRVLVFSNLPEVELFCNGISLGKIKSPDHYFSFEVPNKGVSQLVAQAGNRKDFSTIKKVSAFNDKYRLKEKGALLNWFDIEAPQGFLSLNHKVSKIISTPQGRELFNSLMPDMKSTKLAMAGFEMGPEMMNMMGGFTLLRLLTLMGGMMNISYTREQLLEINERLNKIAE